MKITLPTRSLMSAKFKYTPACATDVRKTWEKFARLQRMKGDKRDNVAVHQNAV